MATVLVAGALANKPLNGGAAWVRLSWIGGLARLGFDVYFIEQIEASACFDSENQRVDFEQSLNRMYFDEVVAAFGLSGSSALLYDGGSNVHGATWPEVLEWAEEADMLVNMSGHLNLDPLLRRARRKVFVDTDPGFTQMWHSAGLVGARLAGHDLYFTIGENIGARSCTIPTAGIRWRKTRQPVLLEHWPVVPAENRQRFTTVASWRGPFGPVEFEGKTYGLKAHEFRKFVALPEMTPMTFELALDIDCADYRDARLLRRHGWRLVDVGSVDRPGSFRSYVQASAAEFSVAQGIYVETCSGWFSDRTTRYLASGKPALVQDTGFSRSLPVGEGLIAFRSLDEAAAGAAAIVRDYDRHAAAARDLAESYFDSDRVLAHFVDDVGVSP
jgi:hypothetical protein